MQHVPDHAEPTDSVRDVQPTPSRRPVEAVLLDFHGTLAQVEEPREWVLAAAATCGVDLDRVRATSLADRLLTAGRAGGPLPARVPPQLAELWADRDLYEHAHRGAYTGLAATVDAGIDGFADALYERVLTPEGWVPYPDTAPTLAALRAAGVRVAVVSNIGFDIRPHFAAWGLADLVDAFVLSYEVGRCKPDPAIFWRACGMLGVDPEHALMVGDTPADAGAVAAGCAALVLPAADVGRPNGLGSILSLTTL
ncbi:had-superfamily hydrolase, subfamily ia, variant 3 [Micromonospora maris AB-18-032]|nr:had-superfamily hydrolase, subfamily ia, variant 3 [Micromonospora maris AB-18-032]